MHFLAPAAALVCSELLEEFSMEPGELPHEADVWGVSGHHENSQLSPVVFSRDTALVSSEEFNHHVMLVTDLFFSREKWA